MNSIEVKVMKWLGHSLISRVVRHLEGLIGMGSGGDSTRLEVDLVATLSNFKPKLIFDVGANKGQYSEELLKQHPSAGIVLFEPNKINFDYLTAKFKMHQNVKVENLALGKSSSSAILYSDHEGSGLASLTKRNLKHYQIDFEMTEKVLVQTLDSYCLEHKVFPDYIKIDVEGHELDVLHGGLESISKATVVQFEFGGCNVDTRTFFLDYWEFFRKFGFTIFRISPLGLIKINSYSEALENFVVTNYVAFNETF